MKLLKLRSVTWKTFENFLDNFHFLKFLIQAYSKANQTPDTKFFAEVVNGFRLLTIFLKNLILNVWLDSEFSFAYNLKFY